MNNTDLNYSLKRLTNASNKLLECEKEIEALSDKIANVSVAVERIAVDLNGAKNLVAVQYCPKCINCTSTLADGAHCTLSKLPVGNRDYCSRFKMCPDSLCWDCKNATGGCEWSQSFTPVDGWEAIPRTIGNKDSFCVIKCPKFVED